MMTGTFSARIDSEKFLITPYPLDRHSVLPEDLVMIRKGKKEFGKHPSRAVFAHKAIYDAHPDIGAIDQRLSDQCDGLQRLPPDGGHLHDPRELCFRPRGESAAFRGPVQRLSRAWRGR